jgi:hypothetical protein
MFDVLKKYKEEYGHCNVPGGWAENKPLSTWVKKQRSRKEMLSDDRIKRLEDIRFVWKRNKSTWEEKVNALKEYKKLHGNCNVPQSWAENKPLAKWVSHQRNAYKDNKLTKDRIVRLEDMGFVWNTLESQWEELFEALKKYKKVHGHCNVPSGWAENKPLATWVNNQRSAYRKKAISGDRVKRLEDMGFPWNTRESQWVEMFVALKEYKKSHGNCNVPQLWTENKLLGRWVSVQRTSYRKGQLNDGRIKRLEDEGFVW